MDSNSEKNNASGAKGPYCQGIIRASGPSELLIRSHNSQTSVENTNHGHLQSNVNDNPGGDDQVSLVQQAQSYSMNRSGNRKSQRLRDLASPRTQQQMARYHSNTPSDRAPRVQNRTQGLSQQLHDDPEYNRQLAEGQEHAKEILIKAREYTNQCLSEERKYIEQELDHAREHVEGCFAEERERTKRKINNLKLGFLKNEMERNAALEKITDDQMKKSWEMLGWNIRNVVYMFRGYQPKGDAKTLETLRARLAAVSFENVPVESHKDLFEAYLEAFLWKFVYTEVFSGSGRQWRTSVIRLVQEAKREITKTGSDPQKRAETALWFAQGSQAVTDHLTMGSQQPMADKVAASLFSMMQSVIKDVHQQQVKDTLGVIVHDATKLAMDFLASKALFIPDWPMQAQSRRIWNISDFYRENIAENQSSARFVVIRPALEKFGNADGENHEHSVVLCQPALVYY